MTGFNNDNMMDVADNIIKALNVCLVNKTLWKNDKPKMLKLLEADNPVFYDMYPMICNRLIYCDDIKPLLGMISIFNQVQSNTLSLEKGNSLISSSLNKLYVDDVLNSEKLTKEREEKMRTEQTNKK